MKSEMWIFYFLTIYGALVLCVVLKFIKHGLRGEFMLTAVLAPLDLLIVLPILTMKSEYQRTRSISLMRSIRAFGTTFMFFPVLVDAFAASIAEKSKQKTHDCKNDY